MIAYAMLGSNDVERAKGFYDQVMAALGAKVVMQFPGTYIYGNGKGAMLSVNKPHDGKAATVGNGSMIAIGCESEEQIQKIHALALSLGGSDEGAPGPRGEGFYGAYFRDLDGNKLCLCKFG
jgi:predicted lactoylglutathione lyase